MKLIYENNSNRFLFQTLTDFSFPAHLHSGLELFLVIEGELQVTIGNNSQILKAGELGVAFPNQIHGYHSEGFEPWEGTSCVKKETSRGILILCPVEMGGDYLPVLLGSHPVNPFLVREILHPDIVYAMNSLLKTGPDLAENLPIIRAFIQLILARMLSATELMKNRDNRSPDITAQLVTYLSEHYFEPVTLEILAKQLGISKYSVSRVFSEKLHMSFSNYVNTLRIDNAKLLLQGTDEDILTVSARCGYENPRTFNREFMTLCGCKPREYRKKRQSNNYD